METGKSAVGDDKPLESNEEKSPTSATLETVSSPDTDEYISQRQSRRRQALVASINRFVVQLQTGCGNSACSTPTCYTCKISLLPRQARKYNTVTARAMAVELALSENPERYTCPYVLDVQAARLSTDKQPKIDPRSIMQQLYNTKAFRSLQAEGIDYGKFNLPNKRVPPSSANYVESSDGAKLREGSTCVTCDSMTTLKVSLTSIDYRAVISSLRPGCTQVFAEESYLTSLKKMLRALSSLDTLMISFNDRPLDILDASSKPELPSLRLDQAFRGWPSSVQVAIFDSLWLAMDTLSKVEPSRADQQTLLTSEKLCESDAKVINYAVHALTASIPRAQRDIWHIVWSTVVNGRAYGKQRSRRSDIYTSPWLHILDAFESEPALRLAENVIKAIAARSRHYGTFVPEKANIAFGSPVKISNTQNIIMELLIEEEAKVRFAKYGRDVRVDNLHGKHLIGTTSLIWLEWLRKCFLKHWDGGFRLDRMGIAGAALELMEGIWIHRDRQYVDLPDDIFATPVVFNTLNVDKAARDWIDYQLESESGSRHILSFKFLFITRAATAIFRTINHVRMRRAHCQAGALHKLRAKAMSRWSHRDSVYLDLRMKTVQEPYLVLRINRHSVLADANDQLWHRLKSELAKPLRVRMGIDEGEIGHDLGGVQIEFFKLACIEAMNPDYAMFTIDPQTNFAWFQIASMIPLYKYELFGTLVALAVYNGVTLPLSFPLLLYRNLLNQQWETETDLVEAWPTLMSSFAALEQFDGDVEEDLARDFTFSFIANGLHLEVDMEEPWKHATNADSPGKMKIFRLYPDKHHPERRNREIGLDKDIEPGSPKKEPSTGIHSSVPDDQGFSADTSSSSHKVPDFNWPGWDVEMAEPSENPRAVTNANRTEYVIEYMRWVRYSSVRPQYTAFARGFYSVLDFKALWPLTPETLRKIVEGQKHLDISLLKQAATYRGYDSKSPVIRWFWETVQDYPEAKQNQLLEFVTASSRVPVNGAESLTFIIEKMVGDPESLPGSSTCFSTLRLPDYESKYVLQKKLDIALQHSLGFGQA